MKCYKNSIRKNTKKFSKDYLMLFAFSDEHYSVGHCQNIGGYLFSSFAWDFYVEETNTL